MKIGRTNKENRVKNWQPIDSVTESDWVTRMAWGDDDEQEILVTCGVKEDRK